MKTKLLTLFLALVASVGTIFATDTITVAQALQIGSSLTIGQTTAETYFIVGYVSKLAGNATDYANYGDQSYWITDDSISTASSNSAGAFYVYRGAAGKEISVGHKVSITCQIKNYNGTIENNGTKLSVEVLNYVEEKIDTITVAEAVEIALALENNKETDKKYAVAGFAKKVIEFNTNYKNQDFYIVDNLPAEEGALDIQCYHAKIARPGCVVGDPIIIVGKLKNSFNDMNNTNNAQIREGEANIYDLIYSLTLISDAQHGSSNYVWTWISSAILTATPNYGYHFVEWSDGNKDNPRTIELTQDTTLTAEFAIDRNGKCGYDMSLTWNYDDQKKTLFISGEGALDENYTFGLEAPMEMTKLIIEKGVTNIGKKAFYGRCSEITSIALPSTVTTIGDSAFIGLNNRKFNTLVLPSKIVNIGAYAFDGASYLQTIHFGSALEEIGAGAFNGCTRVKEMTCLAEITPNVGTYALTSINSLAKLYIPEDYLFDYQIDNNWNRFQLQTIGATGTTVTENEVAISANDNTATFTWPTDDNAANYTIEITKDGVVFCTLIFNANGQLTGIAFAPGRDGNRHAPTAIMTANGMQFTVTGLNSGTNYAFSLTAKDSQNAVVASYSGEFTTTGAPAVATDLDDVQSNDIQCTKVLRDGQIYLMYNGTMYNVQGQEAK